MSYESTVLADNPHSYWRMDAPSGTTELDVQKLNNGTYSGQFALNQEGIPGAAGDHAVQFNSSEKTGKLEILTVESITKKWTVECWIKPEGSLVNQDEYFSTRKPVEYGFDVKIENNGSLSGVIGNGSSFLTTEVNTEAGVIKLNEWNHVVHVVTEAGWKVYVNGVVRGENTFSGIPVLWTVEHAIFVATFDAATASFKGAIDEVAVYDTVLSGARIKAHYEAGSTMPEPPTVENPGMQHSRVLKPVLLQIKAKHAIHYLAANLPKGLVINESTGLITGNPTTEESPKVKVVVENAAAETAETAFEWIVIEGGTNVLNMIIG